VEKRKSSKNDNGFATEILYVNLFLLLFLIVGHKSLPGINTAVTQPYNQRTYSCIIPRQRHFINSQSQAIEMLSFSNDNFTNKFFPFLQFKIVNSLCLKKHL
jgi:hypothetical protein